MENVINVNFLMNVYSLMFFFIDKSDIEVHIEAKVYLIYVYIKTIYKTVFDHSFNTTYHVIFSQKKLLFTTLSQRLSTNIVRFLRFLTKY